jgi:glycosyltransferase 2 family protein
MNRILPEQDPAPEAAAAAPPPAKPSSRLHRLVVWLPGLLALIALAFVLLQFGELKQLYYLLDNVSVPWLGFGVLAQLCTYAAAAAVWYVVLRRAAHRRHLAGLFLLGVAKLFMDQALPSGGVSGSVLVVAALRRRGVSAHIATAALLIGMLSFYLAFLTAAGASLIIMALEHALNSVIVLVVIVFLFIALALVFAIFWLRRRKGSRFEAWLRYLPLGHQFWSAIHDAPSILLRDVTLLVSTTLLQILIIALDAATLWIVLAAIGTRAPFGICFAAFTLASIIADVAPIPLGLGSFEAGLVSLLTLTGTGLEAAFAGTILLRGLTFWAPMLPGLWLARREIRGAAALKGTKSKADRMGKR